MGNTTSRGGGGGGGKAGEWKGPFSDEVCARVCACNSLLVALIAVACGAGASVRAVASTNGLYPLPA